MTAADVLSLAELLRDRRIVVLSGAGASTESGIPDYRGPGTLRRARKPMPFSQFVASDAGRKRYWARSVIGWPRLAGARPNPGHEALAALEERGCVVGLITQNVDRLHHRAGSRRIVELHGALAEVLCLACGRIEDRADLQRRLLELNPGFAATGPTLPDGDVGIDDELCATSPSLTAYIAKACSNPMSSFLENACRKARSTRLGAPSTKAKCCSLSARPWRSSRASASFAGPESATSPLPSSTWAKPGATSSRRFASRLALANFCPSSLRSCRLIGPLGLAAFANMSLHRIIPAVKRYPWGSKTALAKLFGPEYDCAEPIAELWFGDHLRGPAHLDDGRALGDCLGEALPFLLKVLSAAQPLSIQCHPSREQAERGFERENAAGVDIDAPERSYRDCNHKPELLVAMTPFFALCGFRDGATIADAFERCGLESFATECNALRRSGDIEAFMTALFRAGDATRQRALGELDRGHRNVAESPWIERLLRSYPGDLGALAPLYLHLVELAPGQGLFLGPGQLHAYLEGTGIELMASSDNVLRGGLTEKHIDAEELLAVLRFDAGAPVLISATPSCDGDEWRTPESEFRLSHWHISPGQNLTKSARASVEIALCTRGAVTVSTRDCHLDLTAGQATLLEPAHGELRLEGNGDIYIARVP